jgi:hypothetical protein
VGAKTEAGTRVPAISPPNGAREWLCNYPVASPVRTVIVYLGHGGSPSGTGIDREGATQVRGNVYVSITAQYPDKTFGPRALQLAQIAISRTVGTKPAGGQT